LGWRLDLVLVIIYNLTGHSFNLASPMDLILDVGKLVVHPQAKDVVLASFIFVVWAILNCHI